MTKETGTLAELNVKPGDVVKCVGWYDDGGDFLVGEQYTIMAKHPKGYYDGLCAVREGGWKPVYQEDDTMLFRVVSRASSDTPTTWGEMTDEEKSALLLADYQGKTIEFINGCDVKDWKKAVPKWADFCSYRVKPEPKRETVTIYGAPSKHIQWCLDQCGLDTHCITFDLIDGRPDCASIDMEEL